MHPRQGALPVCCIWPRLSVCYLQSDVTFQPEWAFERPARGSYARRFSILLSAAWQRSCPSRVAKFSSLQRHPFQILRRPRDASKIPCSRSKPASRAGKIPTTAWHCWQLFSGRKWLWRFCCRREPRDLLRVHRFREPTPAASLAIFAVAVASRRWRTLPTTTRGMAS